MSFLTFITGSTKSWQPAMTVDTTTASYWLNWRVLLCSIWILMSMVFASILISKHECRRNSEVGSAENQQQEEPAGIVYEDEVWRPCLRSIHPGWLLGYRVFAFFVLLLMLILNVAVDGGSIFYFYTQWTFTLITIYFALGSLLSIHGCCRYRNRTEGDEHFDTERGSYGSSTTSQNNATKGMTLNQEPVVRQKAGSLAYVFQIIFQRFPWFRIGYFFLWTAVYVLFQWIVHACIAIWWPYPFLDLSSSYAPLWYSTVALMHIPCYGIFVLIMKAKHCLLSKWFPQSYSAALIQENDEQYLSIAKKNTD
ncbi:UNVERIFIED_CONTAM: hypothetical protein Scaly_1814400 [Sesamum calycinum]|uniref:Uncharacterized protein n=1 Tax=Sesamum calycinum TaxID=2727403 RepID=A0AAW2NE71_9LAMI